MDYRFNIGDKVIYTRKGDEHVSDMTKFIGQVLTIEDFNITGDYVYFREVRKVGHGYRFDITAMVPAVTKVR